MDGDDDYEIMCIGSLNVYANTSGFFSATFLFFDSSKRTCLLAIGSYRTCETKNEDLGLWTYLIYPVFADEISLMSVYLPLASITMNQ